MRKALSGVYHTSIFGLVTNLLVNTQGLEKVILKILALT